MGDTVLYDRRGPLGFITLNRPSSLNAINDELIEELIASAQLARNEHATRVVILRGAGRAFCAGADLKEATASERRSEDHVRRTWAEQELARTLRRIGKPLLAQIHGYALGGGCELAMLADLRIAGEGARFGFPEVAMGAIVTTGGHFNLARTVGLASAFELLYTGEMIDAAKALTLGIVSRVVPDEQLENCVEDLARGIAKQPPLELALTRDLLYGALDIPFDSALDNETYAELVSLTSDARRKGMSSAVRRIGDVKPRISK